MKQFFRKKQLMMVALVAALGMAVYLNYYLASDPTLSAGADQSDTSAPEDTDHLGDATFVGAGVSDPEDQPEDSSAPQPEGDT